MCKRCILTAACVFQMAVAGACQSNSSDIHDMVKIGSTRPDLFGMPAEFRALHPRLEECLNCNVRFPSQPNGAALGMQLEQGQIQYAVLSAKEFAEIEHPEKITLLASAVNSLGKTSRQGLMVVKAGSNVKSLPDCAGKRFAFGTHKDLLTDVAACRALEEAGLPPKKLLIEALPPPLAFEGRLFCTKDVARTIVHDLTVNAGVVDEVAYDALPETGGNLIVGASKDQLMIVGRTIAIPELAVAAGPSADPQQAQRLRDYLIQSVQDDPEVCRQLGISGFAPANPAAYDQVQSLIKAPSPAKP